jgi:DNA-directed RNA polymerase specialized sigma24 family protein
VQVADQDDESEFSVMLEAAAYYNRYVAKVGGLPADAEDLTVEQISAVVRKVKTLGQPPLRL